MVLIERLVKRLELLVEFKLNRFISKYIRKLPWFIIARLSLLNSQVSFYTSSFRYLKLFHSRKLHLQKITFQCGFHGKTGAVESIANIANLLAEKYDVEFVSFPSSNFNTKLSSKVKIVRVMNPCSNIYLCDLSCDEHILQHLKSTGKKVLLTVHGMLNSQFGLTAKQKLNAIEYADVIQFVSDFQMEEYGLIPEKCFVIPNMVKPVKKTIATNNVGVVGNLNLKNKNVDSSVEIALASQATSIHLWSINSDKWEHPSVICHDWESNKEVIFNSFDVLVFMSKEETQGMGILESMSAGVPCLLSNISAFEQFQHFPGIHLVEPSDIMRGKNILNDLLLNKASLKQRLIEDWEHNYSQVAVEKKWFELIDKLL